MNRRIFFKKSSLVRILAGLFLVFSVTACHTGDVSVGQKSQVGTWQDKLSGQLPMLGHRNWILVVDKAFPLQTSGGMEYVYADESLLPVLTQVLDQLKDESHIKPILFRDKELAYISERQAGGVQEYRTQLDKLLAGSAVQTLDHDSVFRQLDESSKLFKVLVIKTKETISYNSVFMQLDCKYWDATREKELRDSMQ